ncbi:MAG: hypothetical protein RBT63_09915, partial [Bdellovibrionales bacterium]|nr:hypothetical protein [Bdellovibrionales bacterium]
MALRPNLSTNTGHAITSAGGLETRYTNDGAPIPVTLEFRSRGTLVSVTVFDEATSSQRALDASDFEVVNATIAGFTGADASGVGASYSFVLNPNADGLVSVRLAAGVVRSVVDSSAESDAGSTSPLMNVESNNLLLVLDRVAPTLVVTGPTRTEGNSATAFSWSATYSDADVISLKASDIAVITTGDVACAVPKVSSGSTSATRSVVLESCTGDGTVKIEIAGSTARDYAGNFAPLFDLTTAATVDNTPPVITVQGGLPVVGDKNTLFRWQVAYSGAVTTDLKVSDIELVGSAEGCSVAIGSSMDIYIMDIYINGCQALMGTLSIRIRSGTAEDSAGNRAAAVGTTGAVAVENPVFVSFATASDVVEKSAGVATHTVDLVLSEPAPADMTVSYSLSPQYSTAVNPTNHNMTSGSVLIPRGASSGQVSYQYQGASSGSKALQFVLSGVSAFGYRTAVDRQVMRRLVKDSGAGDVVYKTVSVGGGLYDSNGHVCAITKDDKLRCWGSNGSGQLGDSTQTRRLRPIPIDTSANYLKISTGGDFTCGIVTGNKLKCWGGNSSGQLGNGVSGIGAYQLQPVPIDATESYLEVGTGRAHGCGITTGYKLKCWGSNAYGQVGDGTTDDRTVPTPIDAAENYAHVSLGDRHTCALTTGQKIKCWGANSEYQL